MSRPIEDIIQDILEARYGEQVRGSIVEALLWNNDSFEEYLTLTRDARDQAIAAKTSAQAAQAAAEAAVISIEDAAVHVWVEDETLYITTAESE